jgi:murein DD-endopeptidase MepM/ murein hydrolase activator NlpD
MLASSAFVLAALTMTGVYMKGQNVESKDDGYTLDFTALENNADDKMQEISEYNEEHLLKEEENIPELTANNTAGNEIAAAPVTEDDLDYLPQEVGSGHVEIPGLTDQETLQEAAEAEQQMPELTVEKTLHFTENDGMQKPVQSDILMHYSMDKSIYFATLDQYKYNPATIFSAEEGMTVTACAQGKVTSIFENEEIGKAVTLDLGDGYEATYGQLSEITVKENAYVNPGETIGSVAAPTKYYSAEGSNVYFALTHNGDPVNGEALIFIGVTLFGHKLPCLHAAQYPHFRFHIRKYRSYGSLRSLHWLLSHRPGPFCLPVR